MSTVDAAGDTRASDDNYESEGRDGERNDSEDDIFKAEAVIEVELAPPPLETTERKTR